MEVKRYYVRIRYTLPGVEEIFIKEYEYSVSPYFEGQILTVFVDRKNYQYIRLYEEYYYLDQLLPVFIIGLISISSGLYILFRRIRSNKVKG